MTTQISYAPEPTTATAPRTKRQPVPKLCLHCHEPGDDNRGLVGVQGGLYEHPGCNPSAGYELVQGISFPDEPLGTLSQGQDREQIENEAASPTEGEAVFDSGAGEYSYLCQDCRELCRPYDFEELCPVCQEAANQVAQDRYDGPPEPDYEQHYRELSQEEETFREGVMSHAERGRKGGKALAGKVHRDYFRFIGRRGGRVHVHRFFLRCAEDYRLVGDREMVEYYLEKAENWRDELHNRVMLDLWQPSQVDSYRPANRRRRKANTWPARLRRWELTQGQAG